MPTIKNPAYGKHRISRPMWIVGPIQEEEEEEVGVGVGVGVRVGVRVGVGVEFIN